MKNKHALTQLIAFIIFILCVFSYKLSAQSGNKVVVGYIPTYRNFPGIINTTDLDVLTHLDIAFVNPDANANIYMPNGTATVVNAAHAKNVKVLASICGGGGNGSIYQTILSNNNLTNTFVANLTQMCVANNLDGIDVDIEGDVLNGTYVNATQYESFILKLRTALHAQNKLITAALAGWFTQHVTNTAAQAFDFIGLMSYDAYGGWTGPGQHSPYEMAVNDFNYWRNTKGVAANKLVIGLPFYGYGWGTNQRAWTFNEITTTYPGSENNDQVGSGANVIYYNGIPTIERKCDFAMQNALGVMIWELTQDASGNKSLLQAVGRAMGKSGGNTAHTNLATGKTITASSTEVGGNLANNINDRNYVSRWSSLYADNQWIAVNLNGTFLLDSVKIRWESALASAFQVQVSADGNNWTTVQNVTNNTATQNKYSFQGNEANHVRINCLTRASVFGFSIYELEVYGKAKSMPFKSNAFSIPGKIEAEDYDLGGQGIAYNDLTTTNTHGSYRTDGVDIEACTDAGGGFNVGGTQVGEWLNYSVNVTSAASYQFNFRVAAVSAGKTFHIELNGTNISGAISVPNTGGWQTWQTVSTAPIALSSGNKNLRIVFDSELINLNHLEVVAPVITSISQSETIDFKVYPNPAKDFLQVIFPADFDNAKIEIINTLGTMVLSEYSNTGQVDVSNLSSGVYILTLSNEHSIYSKRVFISK